MATTERRPISGAVKAAAQSAAPRIEEPMAPEAPPPVDPTPPVEEVVPVDTESVNYKAGFQNAVDGIDVSHPDYKAGYAAGLGSTGATTPASEPEPAAAPADGATASVGKPATVAELRSLAGDDNGFCMDCLGEGLTLTQATAKFAAKTHAELKAERKARLAAEAKLKFEGDTPRPIGTASTQKVEDADPDDPKAVAEKEWNENTAALKARGFKTKYAFVGLRVAELTGRFRSTAAPAPAA